MQNIVPSDQPVRISELHLDIIDLPQHEVFQSAVGVRASRRALIVKATDKDGNVGYGECSSRVDPFYSHEFLEACVLIIQQFIQPQLLSGQISCASELCAELNKIRGWNFAKSAVMDAIFNSWYAADKSDPLTTSERILDSHVPIGISLGIYDDLDVLFSKISDAIETGYRRIKLKASPTIGAKPFQAVRREFPDIKLLLDANGSFQEMDFSILAQLAELNLEAIEQPFAADRLDLSQRMKKVVPNLRICLDESVSSIGHLYSALQMQAIDELNIKIGRVGGLLNAIRLDEICAENGILTWVGGMFETGVGRTNNLRFAATLPNAKAHDLSPSSRYFIEDIVMDELVMDQHGLTPTPSQPPRVDETRMAKYRVKDFTAGIGLGG